MLCRVGVMRDGRPVLKLTVYNPTVLRGTGIVLPRGLCVTAVALDHQGHVGIVVTKLHVMGKSTMARHCTKLQRDTSCHGCQIVARPDVPERLRPTELPEGPRQDITN